MVSTANAGVSLLGLVEPPKGFSDIRYVAGVAGREFRINEGPGFGTAAEALQQRVHTRRTWADAYGHVLVATGRADIMLDPVMNVWDCAALLPIIEQAGGTFTDWGGARTIDGGNAISTNGRLFGDVMDVIRKEQKTPSPLGRGLG